MIFSVVNGSFSYQIKAKPLQFLLRDLNFSLEKGQLMAVLGPNGAGKTTLLRCMMGLLHWQKGMTLLDGENLKNFRHDQLWRKIAYVPQAKSSVGMFTVFDMVLLGRSSHFGMLQQPGAEDRRIAAEALAMLHISTLAKRNCGQISGGELQMVLIARALAAQPELLVLDEPESNLDFKNQLIVLDAMTELTQQGISCIFNTHYPAHAMQRADQSLLLDKQGNYLFGATADIITEDNIEAAFGVKTVIGEIETEHRIYRDILPVSVLRMDFEKQHNRGADIAHRDSSESKEGNVMAESNKTLGLPREADSPVATRVAIIGIIVEDRDSVGRINELLHEYGIYVIGRMGMPYDKKGISIISVVVDAPENIISALSGKLGMVGGVSIKTTYSKI